jgi:hypothetical protein
MTVSDLQTDVEKSYRVLAEQCREMAKHAAMPAVLLMRAEALEASADALDERPEPSLSSPPLPVRRGAT